LLDLYPKGTRTAERSEDNVVRTRGLLEKRGAFRKKRGEVRDSRTVGPDQ